MALLAAVVAVVLAVGCCAAPPPAAAAATATPAAAAAVAAPGEAAALLQLRDAFSNWGEMVRANGLTLVGWTANATADACSWSLVTCDAQGRVTEL